MSSSSSNNNDLIASLAVSGGGRVQPLTIGKTSVMLERHLAEGGFARVYQGHLNHSPNSKVAVKHIHTSPEPASYEPIIGEVELMKIFRHKNIVQLIDYSMQRKHDGAYEIFICMKFCAGGQVVDLMNRRLMQNRRFTEAEVLKIFGDLAEAVAYLHYLQPPVIHRDLKVENVLLHSDGSFKLCDFGSCTKRIIPAGVQLRPIEMSQLQEELDKHTTLQYRAPEMCDLYKRRGLTEKVDIWALGVLLYKLCFFVTPFENEGSKLAILNGRYQIPPGNNFSAKLIQLIKLLLTDHPAARPDIYQTLSYVCEMRGMQCPIQNIYTKIQETGPTLPPKDFPRDRKRQVVALNDDLSGLHLAAASQQNAPGGVRRGRQGRTNSHPEPANHNATPNYSAPKVSAIDEIFDMNGPISASCISPANAATNLDDIFGKQEGSVSTSYFGRIETEANVKNAGSALDSFDSTPSAISDPFGPALIDPFAATKNLASSEPRQIPDDRRHSAAPKYNSTVEDIFGKCGFEQLATQSKTPATVATTPPAISAKTTNALQELGDIFGAFPTMGNFPPKSPASTTPNPARISGGSFWANQ